jgi:two-component system cell cycle sensor histidine kinase/response regulator CckA
MAEERRAKKPKSPSPDAAARLVHELRVHQVELEAQNEELRRAQDELNASRERYVDLYDFAPVGYFTLDRDGSILEANLTGAKLLGVERGGLLGRRFGHYVAWGDRDRFHVYCQQLGNPGAARGAEIRIAPQGGGESYVLLEGAPARSVAGVSDQFMLAVSDISSRKQAEDSLRQLHAELEKQVQHRTAQLHEANRRLQEELAERMRTWEALRESEELFRNLADTAPVMIWIAGPDKKLTFHNKTWLAFTGRTAEEDRQMAWTESVHPEDLDRCVDWVMTAFDQRQPWRLEYRLRRADGEYRWVLCNGVPRFASGGAFAGYIGSVIDITDVRRAHEQAFESQKLESLGVLTSGIAHDFNNLLGSILAETELQLGEHVADSPLRTGLKRIKGVAVRAAEIVRELMAYAGQENPVFQPVDLSGLVGEMLQLLKISISKQAVLEVDLPESLPAVWANAAQIRQVVMNLITNASEALEQKGGIISISVAKARAGKDLLNGETPSLSEGDYVQLVVADTGCGMTPEIQKKIFDPFFTTKFAGRGLGLGAVQGIIRSHNGSIRVVSAPGQGSRFDILLPCAPTPRHDTNTTRDATAAREDAARTILLVEDEETLCLAVSKMLRKRGFSVLEAGDGDTAVEVFRANQSAIDLVLLDLTLPGMSGRDALREFRRIRPDVKVIVTTAYNRETALNSLGELQPWDFLRKPYQFRELAKLLGETSVH